MQLTTKINLGDKVKDRVTKFKGIVTAFCLYFNGCKQYGIQSLELNDGKPTDMIWIDEDQLEVVITEAVKSSIYVESNGGQQESPVKRQHPPTQYDEEYICCFGGGGGPQTPPKRSVPRG